MLINDITDPKRLAVLLPEADHRRLKTLAASYGLTLRQALHHAFEAWAAQLQTRALAPAPQRDTPAGADADKRDEPDRVAARQPDQDPPAEKPSSASGRGQPKKKLEGAALAWFRKAGTLDWAQCPATELVPTTIGNVRMVRGTQVPVSAIFQRFAEGQKFGEIAQALGLTPEQLKRILQFAAKNRLFPGYGG
jgi:uncharacterized protein (DUF433 family)